MSSLDKVIRWGFPENRKQLPKILTDFWQHRHALEVVNGVVLYKNRIIIPKVFRGVVTAHTRECL